MRKVVCDGCGYAEPDTLPSKKRQIQSVSLVIVKDERFPGGSEKYDADLCPNCRGILLHTYFKIPAKGQLELPAFIGPKMLDNVEQGS